MKNCVYLLYGESLIANFAIYMHRDADFIFYTVMEYQKYCMAATPDAVKANQTFMGTVVTKFTPEGFHTLRRYLGTMPDVKNVINLHLRASKFTDAGVTMARRAFEQKGDGHERQNALKVGQCSFSDPMPLSAVFLT